MNRHASTPPPPRRDDTLTRPPRWQDAAICQTTDPEIFFPERGTSSATAKRICQTCPVRLPCLIDGLEDQDGVWGGMNPDDRHRLRKAIAATPARRARLLAEAATTIHPSTTTHLDKRNL